MTSLRLGIDHNRELQSLYDEDSNFIFEFSITSDREEAYDLEQYNLDKLIDHPMCLNVNNNARNCWSPRTMPDWRKETLCGRNTEIHGGNKYREGMRSSLETRQRLSESMTKHWDVRGRTERKERPPRLGARGRVVEGIALENMRQASIARGVTYSRRVIVNGVEYPNATYAANALGFSRRTVIVRIYDERYPDWKYVD